MASSKDSKTVIYNVTENKPQLERRVQSTLKRLPTTTWQLHNTHYTNRLGLRVAET